MDSDINDRDGEDGSGEEDNEWNLGIYKMLEVQCNELNAIHSYRSICLSRDE